MWLRLRQVALVAHELRPVLADFNAVFGLEIDQTEGGDQGPDGPWEPAGNDWQKAVRTEVVKAITAVEIQGERPEVIANRWADIIEAPVEKGEGGAPTVALENASIRFVPN